MEQDLSYFEHFGEQVQGRLAKLDNFARRQELAYPPRIRRSHSAAEAIKMFAEAEAALPENSDEELQLRVEVAGRLVGVRIMGKSTFAHIEDGSGRLQVYLTKNTLGDERYTNFKKDFDLGDHVAVQ